MTLPHTKAIALSEDRFPHMEGQVCGWEGDQNGKGKQLLDSWLTRGLVGISKCSASLARACVLALAARRALGCLKLLAKRQPELEATSSPQMRTGWPGLSGEQKHGDVLYAWVMWTATPCPGFPNSFQLPWLWLQFIKYWWVVNRGRAIPRSPFNMFYSSSQINDYHQ